MAAALIALLALEPRSTAEDGQEEQLASMPAVTTSVSEPVAPTTRREYPRSVVQPHEPSPEFASSGVAALSDAAERLAAVKVYEQDTRTFEQKYAGATIGQLVAAKCLLEERRDLDRERIGRELIADNRLVEVPTNAAGDSPAIPGNKDGSPVSCIQTFEVVDGVQVVKAAVISGDEFPDYRAIELEVWWLECRVHALKKTAKTVEPTAK